MPFYSTVMKNSHQSRTKSATPVFNYLERYFLLKLCKYNANYWSNRPTGVYVLYKLMLVYLYFSTKVWNDFYT